MERINTTPSVGLRALAMQVPSTVRTNAYWREHHPQLVATAEQRTLARVFGNRGEALSGFDRAMQSHLSDPFRGARERRVLRDGETTLELEIAAARKVLQASGATPESVDLNISVGFLGRDVVIGNAVHVAKALEIGGACWNLESACAGPLHAFTTACALIRAGEKRRVLVTISCNYSQQSREDDSLSWFMGDGAGAFLVEAVAEGTGYLASHAIHTGDTCGTWDHRLELDPSGTPRITMFAHRGTGEAMRRSAEPHMKACCFGALERAGLEVSDVDVFVTHTPVAWFADFAAEAMGIDRARVVNPYPSFGNLGPALTPVNLFAAARSGLINAGDRVLIYGPGSVSSAVAVVMRWGDVALGDDPEGVDFERFRSA